MSKNTPAPKTPKRSGIKLKASKTVSKTSRKEPLSTTKHNAANRNVANKGFKSRAYGNEAMYDNTPNISKMSNKQTSANVTKVYKGGGAATGSVVKQYKTGKAKKK